MWSERGLLAIVYQVDDARKLDTLAFGVNRMRKAFTYRTQAPRLVLLQFTIPAFLVVLIVALLLGAAPFWGAPDVSVGGVKR